MTSSNGKSIRRDQSGYAWRRARRLAIRNSNGTCGLCRQPIDMTLAYPHPYSVSVDHVQPVSRGGALTSPENLRCCHLICNKRRGNGDPGPTATGCDLHNHTSRDWLGEGLEECPKGNGFHARW